MPTKLQCPDVVALPPGFAHDLRPHALVASGGTTEDVVLLVVDERTGGFRLTLFRSRRGEELTLVRRPPPRRRNLYPDYCLVTGNEFNAMYAEAQALLAGEE